MHLVDEEHLVRLQVAHHCRKIPRPLDHRAGRGANRHPHLYRNHVRERGLAEPGGAVEEDVIERLPPPPGGADRNLQVLPQPVLPDVLVERARTEPFLVLGVFVRSGGSDQTFVNHERGAGRLQPLISARSTSFIASSKRASGAAPRTLSTAFSATGR